MRIESALPAAASVRPRSRPRGRDWGRVDPVELLLLAAFAAMSMWVVASDLWEMIAHGLVWTGTDGFFIVDQMQYLAWIQSASHHLLITNLFVLRPTPSDYFQPAIVISGALVALGVPRGWRCCCGSRSRCSARSSRSAPTPTGPSRAAGRAAR